MYSARGQQGMHREKVISNFPVRQDNHYGTLGNGFFSLLANTVDGLFQVCIGVIIQVNAYLAVY